MTKQNLIFDIDGTLWDATHEITKAYNEVLKRVNDTYPLITDEMMAGIMGFLPEEIADLSIFIKRKKNGSVRTVL